MLTVELLELRNIIYKDLLTLRGRKSTCFPQILRTSKAVNAEASGLPYTLNYINVEIGPDGVYTHGLGCGTYGPSGMTKEQDFTQLDWPDFLRRVRYMRLKFPSSPWRSQTHTLRDKRGESMGNTLYSLCLMLRNGNRLRRLRIEMKPDATSTFESLQSLLYPVRLLPGVEVTFHAPPHSPPIRLSAFSHSSLSHSLAPLFPSTTTSSSSLLPPHPAPITRGQGQKLIHDCIILISALKDSIIPSSPGSGPVPPKKYLRQQALKLQLKGSRVANSRDTMAREHWPAWRRTFRAAIERLRAGLEDQNVLRAQLDPQVLAGVYALLMLDIDFARIKKVD